MTAEPNQPDHYKPLFTFSLGLFLIVLGVGLFAFIHSNEADGVKFQMNEWLMLIYRFLGKYGILGVLGGIGLIYLSIGTYQLRRQQKASAEKRGEAP